MSDRMQFRHLNIARGVAIILVVAGHALHPAYISGSLILEAIRHFIYMIHMPTFFVISGFLFQYNISRYSSMGNFKYLLTKSKSFLVPYVTFLTIDYFISLLLGRIASLTRLVETILIPQSNPVRYVKDALLLTSPMDEHLWFVYIMFLVLTLNMVLRAINLPVLFVATFLFYQASWHIAAFPVILKVLHYLFIFVCGRLLFRVDKQDPSRFWVIFMIVALLSCYLVYYVPSVESASSIFRAFGEISGALLIVSVASKLVDAEKIQCIDFLGKNSYIIYLIHEPYIVPPLLYVTFLIFKVDIFISLLICIVAGIVIPLLLQKMVISKSRFLEFVVLGKKY